MTNIKYKILFMFALTSFLPPFINSSLNIALPFIGKQFEMNIVSIGWITTAFLLSTAIFLVPIGRIADIVGRKKIFMYGIALFTLSSFLCGFATSGLFLIVTRSIQGIGHAMIFGITITLIVSLFPPYQRGQALGVNISGIYLGHALGPVIGGYITRYLGWQYIFFFATLGGLLIIAMGTLYLDLENDHAHAKGERFDLIGSLLYALSIIALLYGTALLPSLAGYIITCGGTLTFILFCMFENYIKHPVFDVHLFLKNKNFAFANFAALLSFSASYAVPLLMSLYLQYGKEMPPHIAGFFLLFISATITLFSPIAGWLSDSCNARSIATCGLIIASASLAILSFLLNTTTPPALLTICLFFFGAGVGLFTSPNTHAAMESVSTRQVSIASSLLSTMRSFGQTLSLGISMLILSLIIGKVSVSRETVPQLLLSIRLILLIFSILFIGSIFATQAQSTSSQPKKT